MWLSSPTAQLLASNVDGRHVYVEYGRVRQERGQSLKEHGPFDPVIIMAATNYLGVSAHPETITHDVLAMHVTCHRAGVRTVFLSLPPQSARIYSGIQTLSTGGFKIPPPHSTTLRSNRSQHKTLIEEVVPRQL